MNTLICWAWPVVAPSEGLFNIFMVSLTPILGVKWMLRELTEILSELYKRFLFFIEFFALFPFRKILRALSARDASLLIELSVALTSVTFAFWMRYGYGSPGVRMLLGHTWPHWAWIAIMFLGLAGLFCTGKSRYVRCQALGITLTLWLLFLGWLNAKLGLTLIHYLVGPLFVFGIIAVILLLRTPYDLDISLDIDG